MPIDYSKYPPDWPDRRARILERAAHRCEKCGAPDRWWKVVGQAVPHDEFFPNVVDAWDRLFERAVVYDEDPDSTRVAQVVLTIAHLDHDAENWKVEDDRLAALCQRCHLQYDAPEKARKRRVKKYRDSLFPFQGEV